ncbi:MAG: TetR family transcriptional regulator [Paracoccaceae bacterium]
MAFTYAQRYIAGHEVEMPLSAQDPDAALLAPRTLDRTTRRGQVIEATIDCLAERGFSRTTVTDVARRAGISHGLVLFHFQSKDNLLAEVLDFLADEYQSNWQEALATAGDAPETQIMALLRADFAPAICTPARLAAWCAYWGESQSRPLYQSRCGAADALHDATLVKICNRMNDLYGYGHNAERTARLLRIMTEGVWLDLMSVEGSYSVDEAIETVMLGARALYPRHF